MPEMFSGLRAPWKRCEVVPEISARLLCEAFRGRFLFAVSSNRHLTPFEGRNALPVCFNEATVSARWGS